MIKQCNHVGIAAGAGIALSSLDDSHQFQHIFVGPLGVTSGHRAIRVLKKLTLMAGLSGLGPSKQILSRFTLSNALRAHVPYRGNAS